MVLTSVFNRILQGLNPPPLFELCKKYTRKPLDVIKCQKHIIKNLKTCILLSYKDSYTG